jgi:hypothetical protein
LENVPAELKIRIMLFLPDVASLRSLISASPSYHATYAAGARQRILNHLVIQQLDHRLYVDAVSAVRSKDFYLHGKRDPSEVVAFLDEYSRARKSPHSSSIIADWLLENEKCRNFEEVIALCLLHTKVSRIIDDYIYSTSPWQKNSAPLSELERIRLYRAICRYQIYCNLFGTGQKMNETPPPVDDWGFDTSACERFLPSFLPWEVQEIACICEYLSTRWASLLRESSIIVPEEPKRVEDVPIDNGWDGIFAHIRSLPLSCKGIVLIAHEIFLYICLSEDVGLPIAEHDDWIYARCHYYLTHLGPDFLAETLPKGIFSRRLSIMKLSCNTFSACRFTAMHRCFCRPRLPTVMVGPANPSQKEGIYAEWSRIPADEQPSAGWMWFSHKYNIPSGGIGPEEWFADESNMHAIGAENELSWGYPFWDIERLSEWGVNMSWFAESSHRPA